MYWLALAGSFARVEIIFLRYFYLFCKYAPISSPSSFMFYMVTFDFSITMTYNILFKGVLVVYLPYSKVTRSLDNLVYCFVYIQSH